MGVGPQDPAGAGPSLGGPGGGSSSPSGGLGIPDTGVLGASFADWFAGPTQLGRQHIGGLGFGYGVVSLVLGVAIICLVAYLDVTRKDVR